VCDVPVFIGSNHNHATKLLAEEHPWGIGFGVVDNTLATATCVDLRFDDDCANSTRFEVMVRNHTCIFGTKDRFTIKERNIEAPQEMFGLIFVDIHCSSRSGRTIIRECSSMPNFANQQSNKRLQNYGRKVSL
jgi:hypothetical protein